MKPAPAETPPTEPSPKSALTRFPLVRWASRMARGQVSLTGRVAEAVVVAGPHGAVGVSAGPVALRFAFWGGERPAITHVDVDGDVRVGGRHGRNLAWGRELRLDEHTLGVGEGADGLVAELVERLHDVGVEVRAEPDGPIELALGGGVNILLSSGAGLTIRGRTVGEPPTLRLDEPLELTFDGGLELAPDRLVGRIGRMAGIKLTRATLSPEGEVTLEADAHRAIERALRLPLDRAGKRLTEMVRASPRARAFLLP